MRYVELHALTQYPIYFTADMIHSAKYEMHLVFYCQDRYKLIQLHKALYSLPEAKYYRKQFNFRVKMEKSDTVPEGKIAVLNVTIPAYFPLNCIQLCQRIAQRLKIKFRIQPLPDIDARLKRFTNRLAKYF